MIYLFTMSLLLFTAADNLNWMYYTHGGIIWSELAKIALVGCIFFTGWTARLWKGRVSVLVLSWLFLHYPIHQIGCGLIRYGNPLYLGSGLFDRAVLFLTGGAWWFYAISLLVSLFVGVHLIIRK